MTYPQTSTNGSLWHTDYHQNMLPFLIITGPTASGKSTFALHLAQRLNGEIVCADSMQIYRDCNIATAKPTPQEQELIPHHLIDIVEPTVRFGAAAWAEAANEAIAQIHTRGKTPIIVGGTGFYLRALLEPQTLAHVPPNPDLRAELEQLDNQTLWEKLIEVDAEAAKRLQPENTKRVVRAIEVAFGEKVLLPDVLPIEYQAYALEWPREILYERINSRVDQMLQLGFMDELRNLVSRYGNDAPALDGIGYKEMLPILHEPSLADEQIETWKRATRRYAKRQMTWFRHQLKTTWLNPQEQTSDEMLDQVCQECQAKVLS
ncbi:MAG: tRNA (adenosine(37)-N6)-dimethylallyltransferase MiaA [Abditibacteriaceae bacterium]